MLGCIFHLGCPPKLVSYRNNQNWIRNLFWHYPKQDICFGCFPLISKQGVSVFQNNRNKQKTNRNSSKFVKISTFLISHTIILFVSAVLIPVRSTETNRKQIFWFGKKQTKKLPTKIEFWFVAVQTEKKN